MVGVWVDRQVVSCESHFLKESLRSAPNQNRFVLICQNSFFSFSYCKQNANIILILCLLVRALSFERRGSDPDKEKL